MRLSESVEDPMFGGRKEGRDVRVGEEEEEEEEGDEARSVEWEV
jgi:hypothetical protein